MSLKPDLELSFDKRIRPYAVPSFYDGRRRPEAAMFQAVRALPLRQRYTVPRPCGPLCRPEVRVPSPVRHLPRWRYRDVDHLLLVQGQRRRGPAGRCADLKVGVPRVGAPLQLMAVGPSRTRHQGKQPYAVPPAYGGLCRPEVGAPSRPPLPLRQPYTIRGPRRPDKRKAPGPKPRGPLPCRTVTTQ